jgi:hypothetical protein
VQVNQTLSSDLCQLLLELQKQSVKSMTFDGNFYANSSKKFDNPVFQKDFSDALPDLTDKIFDKTWDDQKFEFKDAAVNKVLKQMKSNAYLDSIPNKTIEPLVCFWMPITKSSVIAPIIELKISNANTNFDKVTIFSSSIYLRQLRRDGKTKIEIESGQIATRMERLNNLFSIK